MSSFLSFSLYTISHSKDIYSVTTTRRDIQTTSKPLKLNKTSKNINSVKLLFRTKILIHYTKTYFKTFRFRSGKIPLKNLNFILELMNRVG